jgi:hypothetical protein
MMTGKIWCIDCGYAVAQKELDHSFYITAQEIKK